MKKVLLFIMLFSLCSCNNIHASSETFINPINDLTVIDELENKFDLITFETNINKRNEYIASLEASIINEAKILPINTSNKCVLTHTIKSDYCPIIINGKNYYKVKNFAVLDDIITQNLQEEINNNCLINNISYKDYLLNNEINLNNTYSIPFSNVSMSSLDLYDYNNSLQNDVLLQCQDSLLEIDIFGNITSSLAESYTISDDKKEYTFILKDDIYFIDCNGNKYERIKASDFISGFKSMLDKNKNIDIYSNVINVNEYINGKVPFDDVAIKALDDKTLVFSLSSYDSSFPFKIANNCIIPINENFKKSKGLNYANINDLSNMLYTGAYYPTYISNDRITLLKNPYYFDNNISINTINYISDNIDLVSKFNEGTYSEVEITDFSIVDNSLLTYRYNDSSIRYALINTNRKSYEVYNSDVKSLKDEKQRKATYEALNNINFRKALLSCINKQIFIENNKEIDTLSLYSNKIYTDNEYISYNEYVSSLVKDPLIYNLDKAKEYLEKYKQETNIEEEIIIDVLCYRNNTSMANKLNKINSDIENTLASAKVKLNIIYCDSLYDYYLAGHQKYQCYDLYVDFAINNEYNGHSEYLRKIINYI